MDVESALGRSKDAMGDTYGRTWRWEQLARRQASRRGWALLGSGALAAAALVILAPDAALEKSTPYRQGSADVAAAPAVAEQFGTPVTLGAPDGSIQVAGPDGAASLQFDVTGPRGRGTAYVDARRRLGLWEVEHVVVENDNGARIQVR